MRKNSIRKMYIMLCSVILVALLVSFLFQILIMRRTLLANTEQAIKAAHLRSYENIYNYLNNIESIAQSLGYNALVQRYLKETDMHERWRLFTDMQTVFSALSMSQPSVIGFALYDSEGKFITANASTYQAIIQADNLPEQHSSITYSSFYPTNPYIGVTVPYYVMSVPVYDFSTIGTNVQHIGTIVFTMNQAYIREQIKTGNLLYDSSMTLIDQFGHVLIGISDNDSDNPTVENIFFNNGWRLVSRLEEGFIADNMRPLITVALATSSIVVALIIGFFIIFSTQILKPINSISAFMKAVTNDNAISREYHLPKKYNYDEIAYMSNAMNHMIKSLDEKTTELLNKEKENYEVTLARNKMEILAYRSQINPHFLYNTFECISGIAMSKNAYEIVNITESLSQMFSYAVKESDFVTIEDELSHIKYYAVIIGYRFMGRIRISIEVEPGVSSYHIPRLILQPLVENAVFHGLEQKMGDGFINISVSTDANTIHMRVADDGIGMDEPTKKRLSELAENTFEEEKGIGLANIARRLAIFYGGRAEIKVLSELGKGSVIEILLPVGGEFNV